MTSQTNVSALVEKVAQVFGGQIDILVHVTGGLVAPKILAELDVVHWDYIVSLNATTIYAPPDISFKSE